MEQKGQEQGILGIENWTENWRTARYFAPLFEDAATELASRLGGPEVTSSQDVRLELFWHGMRDFLTKRVDENDKMNDREAWKCRIQASYRRLFRELRDDVQSHRDFRPLKRHNYRVSERNGLYENLRHTEVDIAMETPRVLYIGEAKHKMDLDGDSSLVLVHQLIRQYVMAKILVDLTQSGKDIVVFVVGVKDNQAQVQFMIKRGWMKRCNILSWGDIKLLAESPARQL